MNILEWVERLGGWGIVVWIVQRMMRSGERLMEASEGDRRLFREAVDEFREYRRDDERAHLDIIATQERILDAMKK